MGKRPKRKPRQSPEKATPEEPKAPEEGAGKPKKKRARRSRSGVRCPVCGGPLHQDMAALSCSVCVQSYPIREGLVHLAPHQPQATGSQPASQP